MTPESEQTTGLNLKGLLFTEVGSPHLGVQGSGFHSAGGVSSRPSAGAALYWGGQRDFRCQEYAGGIDGGLGVS